MLQVYTTRQLRSIIILFVYIITDIFGKIILWNSLVVQNDVNGCTNVVNLYRKFTFV